MIEQIYIKNFKQFNELKFSCNKTRNIFIGENSSGKSSLLQAISIVLSGSFSQIENLGIINLFNAQTIKNFLANKDIDDALPELLIELYLKDNATDFELEGIHNSEKDKKFGIKLHIYPNEEYIQDIKDALTTSQWSIFPFEYYKVQFLTFSNQSYNSFAKPYKFSSTFINTSLIDTKTEIQKRIDEVYDEHIKTENRHKINHKFRVHSDCFLNDLRQNNLINSSLEYELSFSNSSENAFKDKVTVLKNKVDIKNISHGEKVLLAVENTFKGLSDKVKIVLIEEPENHLSHLNLQKLLDIFHCQDDDMQVFIATHSNMIATRLGIDNCLLLDNGSILSMNNKILNKDTIKFFQKSTNQNFLNFILGKKTILVEGNAEYILMEKLYEMHHGNLAYKDNIQIIAVNGLTFERYLEIAQHFPSKHVVVITDNDKDYQNKILSKYNKYTNLNNISVFSDSDNSNYTFEVCLYNSNTNYLNNTNIANTDNMLDYMLNNKAEFALRLLEKLEQGDSFTIPNYIQEAIIWLKNA